MQKIEFWKLPFTIRNELKKKQKVTSQTKLNT